MSFKMEKYTNAHCSSVNTSFKIILKKYTESKKSVFAMFFSNLLLTRFKEKSTRSERIDYCVLNDPTTVEWTGLLNDLAVRGINLLPIPGAVSRHRGNDDLLNENLCSVSDSDSLSVHLPSSLEIHSVETTSDDTSAQVPDAEMCERLCNDADDVIERADASSEENQNCLVDVLCNDADAIIARSENVLAQARDCLMDDVIARAKVDENSDDLTADSDQGAVDVYPSTFWRQNRLNGHVEATSDDEFYPSVTSQNFDVSDDDFHDCEDNLEVAKTGNNVSGKSGQPETSDTDSSSDFSGLFSGRAVVRYDSAMPSLQSRYPFSSLKIQFKHMLPGSN